MSEEKTIETKLLAVAASEGRMPGVYVKPDEADNPGWMNAATLEVGEKIKALKKFETAKITFKRNEAGSYIVTEITKTKDAEPYQKSSWSRKPDDPYNNTSFYNGCMVQASQYILEKTDNKKLAAADWAAAVTEYAGELVQAVKEKQIFGEPKTTEESKKEEKKDKDADGKNDAVEEEFESEDDAI